MAHPPTTSSSGAPPAEQAAADAAARRQLRVLEGRCRVYQQRLAEAAGHLDELLAYVADCDEERRHTHALLSALAAENESLQRCLEQTEARAEASLYDLQGEVSAREAAAVTELAEIDSLLSRSAVLSGVRARGLTTVERVAQLIATAIRSSAAATSGAAPSVRGSSPPSVRVVRTGSRASRGGGRYQDPSSVGLNAKLEALNRAIENSSGRSRRL